jgi:hypothetical protein
MKELVECLLQWLKEQHDGVLARELAIALARETLKCINSTDVTQRDFDAHDLAAAAGWPEADFDTSKRKIDRANLVLYMESRRASIEEFYRSCAQTKALRMVKRSPQGRHRAQWSLERYDLPLEADPQTAEARNPTTTPP